MGKRKRPEQQYGRKQTSAHQRVSFFIEHDSSPFIIDGPAQNTTTPSSQSVRKSIGVNQQQPARKSAAMACEPSEQDIGTVTAFTACSRETAVRYLRVKKDVDRAVNALFDGEDISREEQSTQWDESAWNTDRDGNANAGGERNLRPLGSGTSTAPTRVSSPSGNLRAPTSKADEDADFAQALAASQQDLSGNFQQESGVVGADGTTRQTYGPANRDHYDKDRWAMVPVSQGASSEIVPDVDPEQRKNMDGEPRFLKNLPSGDYLPSFLTIAHSIPAVREALLLRDYVMAQYGQDGEWWRGHSIALPKIVHTEDGAPANPDIDKFDEFIAETQRLMAVLDASQRSYASVYALTQTELLKSGQESNLVETFIKRVIEAAHARCGQEARMLSLFSTNIGTTSPEGMSTPYLEVFDLPINTTGEEKVGLMETLDSLLWDTTSEEAATSDNFIHQGADILVMRAKHTGSSAEKLQLDVPSTLYLDKYLEENVSIAKPARLEILHQKQRVAKIAEIEKRLTTWQHPQKSNEHIDVKAMFEHTLGHFSGKNLADVSNADKEHGIVVNGTSTPEQPHYAEITSQLERIMLSVDKKLERLSEQKEAIQKNISKLSNSSPSQLEERGLKERYTLMGVATKPSITYVLRRKEDDATDDDEQMSTDNDDDDDGTPDGMQWWRIDYSVNSSQPRILKTKVPGYMVLQGVGAEHTSALLVYASDRAVDETNFDSSLPAPLQRFVEADNSHFATELHDATLSRPPPSYDYAHHDSDIPRQSIEPGANGSRRASNDSTCAQGGDSPDMPALEQSTYANHSGYGLPPDVAAGQHVEGGGKDPEVTEIHLSPPHEEENGGGSGQQQQQQEMVETGHAPFLPGFQRQQGNGEVDAKMEDVREDGAKR